MNGTCALGIRAAVIALFVGLLTTPLFLRGAEEGEGPPEAKKEAAKTEAPVDLSQPAKGGPVQDWSVPVKGFVPCEPGEHPRLLFRRSDLPALRQRAGTPEGQAILRRLRMCLNGGDGESMPQVYAGGGQAPAGAYSMSHVAGFGLLYQITGDKKYAELGKQCFEKAFEGVRNFDSRYSFKKPNGALRAGPSLGWYALGYDLCYDGWDEAYRRKVSDAIQNFDEGFNENLINMARGNRQHPGSNHWGMQVGGAAMALLAVMNDPGVDMDKIGQLLKASAKCMVVNLTQGFGDGGFFPEGDGTGSMSSHIAFLTALQAWRVAAGKDFVSPRPNAQWTFLKWFFLTIPTPGNSDLRKDFPERGAYPHNIWSRAGLSGGGYFGIAFGVANDDQKAAMLWCYNRWLKDVDDANQTPFDTPSPYPHHSVCSFVNWPLGMKERDPDEVFPHACNDSGWGFYAWRNRWQDEDDIVISVLTEPTKGNYSCAAETTLTVWGCGRRMKWGAINGVFDDNFAPARDGSTVMRTGDGSCLAIDFSGASGADGMLVLTGPGAPAPAVDAGGTKFSFLFLTKGAAPAPRAEGNKIVVGNQTVSLDGRKIVLGK